MNTGKIDAKEAFEWGIKFCQQYNIEANEKRIKVLENALRHLIGLKDYKDLYGKTSQYEAEKPWAWNNAREALKIK